MNFKVGDRVVIIDEDPHYLDDSKYLHFGDTGTIGGFYDGYPDVKVIWDNINNIQGYIWFVCKEALALEDSICNESIDVSAFL